MVLTLKKYWLLASCTLLLIISGCGNSVDYAEYNDAEPPPALAGEKMNGLSFVAPVNPVKAQCFEPVAAANANWVTLIPYGYGRGGDPKLNWNIGWQWWGERAEGLTACIKMAHSKGLKVMVKPQIWISHGSYTGDLKWNSDKEWQVFENSFEQFILEFAKIAEQEKAESFCIGTEWREFVKSRPDFWKQLIPKVRKVFSGTLTYAANWDAYDSFPHWSMLDFIGVDAYFPLSNSQTPTVQEFMDGWKPHFKNIESLAQKTGKPVVFTEYGYRNMDNNGSQPWDSGKGNAVNMQAQSNAYEAIFKTFWHHKWFKGGFLWKWYDYHAKAGGNGNNKFTPQNKPAEKILTEWYGKASY